jgi:hypothetical protein
MPTRLVLDDPSKNDQAKASHGLFMPQDGSESSLSDRSIVFKTNRSLLNPDRHSNSVNSRVVNFRLAQIRCRSVYSPRLNIVSRLALFWLAGVPYSEKAQ